MSTNVTTTNWTLKLVPGHTTQYLVDGKAVPMTFQDVTVQVLEGGETRASHAPLLLQQIRPDPLEPRLDDFDRDGLRRRQRRRTCGAAISG